MAAKPDAFLSYTRFDDQHDGGAISEFRLRLSSAVRAVTGEPFEIFQDVDGIGLGERWRGKLDQMLDETRFFIPIITPSFFKSKACRDELEKFLHAEAERRRDDLVLPIYYIESDVLEDPDLRAADPLARAVHERQRQDWRELRFEAFDARDVRRALERLAREIVKARRRAMPTTPTRPTGPGRQPQLHVAPVLRQVPGSDEVNVVEPRPKPGIVFRDIDAPWCPEMVVIPRGEFMMGSTDDDPEAEDTEKPQHLVAIDYGLAVGRYPVTFEQYDRFAEATGREPRRDQGWDRGRRPVIHVSWEDARAYVDWLSRETGESYRLLSEAEWEYVCRAGTTTRYACGDEITPESANYGGTVGETTEVGSYAPNPWNLYDMHGNVWEWVEDCWNDSYEGAPDDGSAWTTGAFSRRVQRGGSWGKDPGFLRSACRSRGGTDRRYGNVGFRVARTLTNQPAVTSSKGRPARRSEYYNPALTGEVTFNYSNNDGRYSFGQGELFFETMWSKASDRAIHLISDPPSIAGIAEAPELRSFEELKNPSRYDFSSRVRTIQEGEHAILKNLSQKYAVLRVLDVKDRNRSDSVDELTFKFRVLADGS